MAIHILPHPRQLVERLDQANKVSIMEPFFRLLRDSSEKINICNKLGKSIFFNTSGKTEEINFENIYFKSDDDPVTQPFLSATKIVLGQSKVSSIMTEVLSWKGRAENSKTALKLYFEKLSFYGHAAKVLFDLYLSRLKYEKIGNRALHLSVLARLASVRPDLVSNADLQRYCQQWQGWLDSEEIGNIQEERQNLIRLIQISHLTPIDLDFDEQVYVHLGLARGANGVRFTILNRIK
jgi:hypothetical protein